MKLNTTDFRRKLQHPLTMALACFPVPLYMLANAAPVAQGLTWALPAAYVLLAWLCLLLPGRLRLTGGLLSIGAMAGLYAVICPVVGHPSLAVPLVLYSVLMLLTLPMGRWERGRELGMEWYVIGAVSHCLVQLLFDGAKRLGNSAFERCEGPLTASFLGLAVLVVLALNRQSLEQASQSRQNVPLLMRRQNLMLVMAVLVIGVLVALIPAIGEAMAWVWDKVMQLLALIGAFIASLMSETKSGGGGGGGDSEPMSLGDAAETSRLAIILEKVMTVLTVIIIVAGAVFVLRLLGKRLVKLLRYLWEKLGRYSAAVGEDYEDEVISTREEDVEREGLLGRLRRFAPEDMRGLDATQRVRVRYRSLKRRRKWEKASTARETLPEEAACLYERARYNGEKLTDAEEERFREATKKI